MKNIIKLMKPGDIIIVALLVVLSFLPVAIFSYQNATTEANTIEAIISVDGETLETFELSEDGETETFEYVNDAGEHNVVVREGTSIYIVEANCSDQLCVRQGEISEVGDTLVCLPHRFVVEISSDGPDMNEEKEIDAVT